MSALKDSQREALMAELGGLRRYCYSLTGNAADADDLLQTTVEKLLQKGMPEETRQQNGGPCLDRKTKTLK